MKLGGDDEGRIWTEGMESGFGQSPLYVCTTFSNKQTKDPVGVLERWLYLLFGLDIDSEDSLSFTPPSPFSGLYRLRQGAVCRGRDGLSGFAGHTTSVA